MKSVAGRESVNQGRELVELAVELVACGRIDKFLFEHVFL
jgi:hypothetical protein